MENLVLGKSLAELGKKNSGDVGQRYERVSQDL